MCGTHFPSKRTLVWYGAERTRSDMLLGREDLDEVSDRNNTAVGFRVWRSG